MSDRRNMNCPATLDIKIKKVNPNTMKNDQYLRRDTPLSAVIKIKEKHNHSTESADALRMLRATPEIKETFEGYFKSGLTAAGAIHHHEEMLAQDANSHVLLANSAVNPTQRTVYHWHEQWRNAKFGAVGNPLPKLQEKMGQYAAQGKVAHMKTLCAW